MPIDPTGERLHEPEGADTPIIPTHVEPAENELDEDENENDDEAENDEHEAGR